VPLAIVIPSSVRKYFPAVSFASWPWVASFSAIGSSASGIWAVLLGLVAPAMYNRVSSVSSGPGCGKCFLMVAIWCSSGWLNSPLHSSFQCLMPGHFVSTKLPGPFDQYPPFRIFS